MKFALILLWIHTFILVVIQARYCIRYYSDKPVYHKKHNRNGSNGSNGRKVSKYKKLLHHKKLTSSISIPASPPISNSNTRQRKRIRF